MKSLNVILLLVFFLSFVSSVTSAKMKSMKKRLTIFNSPRNIGYVYPDLGEYNFLETKLKNKKCAHCK